MEKTKKNNKGFSLVELIVVVLIMAIIAVSLAPQVMKWVDRSRQANDASSYESLYAAAQLSVIADPTVSGTITMNKTKTETTITSSNFTTAMGNNLPDWDKIKITSTTAAADEEYVITITNGVLARTDEPADISTN